MSAKIKALGNPGRTRASDVRTNTHGSNPAQRMQYEGAQLPEAPGISPYRLGSSMYVGECPTPLS